MRKHLLIGCLLMAAAGFASAQPRGSFIEQGQFLSATEYLVSANQKYYAIQQQDGYLCVYPASGPYDSDAYRPMWCHGGAAGGGQFVTSMQPDGNLCIYRGTAASYQGPPLWCSMKPAPGGRFRLSLQDDGNLCVVAGSPPQPGAIWCHNTKVGTPSNAPAPPIPAGPYRAYCRDAQVDGNKLVATCLAPGERAESQWLNLPCSGLIDYIHGRLECLQPTDRTRPPWGKYLQSCTNLAVYRDRTKHAGTLYATCKRNDGASILGRASLPCEGTLTNQNGKLTCYR